MPKTGQISELLLLCGIDVMLQQISPSQTYYHLHLYLQKLLIILTKGLSLIQNRTMLKTIFDKSGLFQELLFPCIIELIKALKPYVCNRIKRLKIGMLSKLPENVCIFASKKIYWFINFTFLIFVMGYEITKLSSISPKTFLSNVKALRQGLLDLICYHYAFYVCNYL